MRFNYSMVGLTLLMSGALTWVPRAAPQILATRDPDRARLVTSDIPNFWRVFDRAPLTNVSALADAFERGYLGVGSAGLADFTRFRLQSERALAQLVAARPRLYA